VNIVEAFLEGKNKDIDLCEDGFIVTDDYAVVIDGAGTPTPMLFNGHKSGKYIMELIKKIVPKMSGEHDHLSFLEDLNSSILEDYKKNDWFTLLLSDMTLRPMASMAVYSKNQHQIWLYGDCKALVNGTLYENNKYIDKVTTNVREFFIEQLLLQGKSAETIKENDVGRNFVMPLLQQQKRFLHLRNSKFGFSMIDGFDFMKETIKIIILPNSINEVILSSDGYQVLNNTLEETERNLKNQILRDPLCIREISSLKVMSNTENSFDDRCYIRIKC
jgi:hypothetical protein